jgi:hypothetical protein
MKTAIRALTTLLIVTLLVVVYLASTGKVVDIYSETYKTAIQLLVVAVTGHVVTFLVTKLNHEREESRSKDEFRRKIIEKLNDSFVEVKRLRRLMRASNTPASGGLPQDVAMSDYHSLMEELNEVQLRLEIVAKEVEAFQGLFKDHPTLQANLDRMEGYLNHIIDEFEHTAPVPIGTPPRFSLMSIPVIADYLGEYKQSRFRNEFIKPYYEALDMLRSELLYAGKNYSAKRPLADLRLKDDERAWFRSRASKRVTEGEAPSDGP